MTWLDAIPVPVLAVGIAVAFVGAVFAGYRLGELMQDRESESIEVSGAAVGSVLTLVGFLIAFTFSLAGSNFDERRQLVIDEANAINGTFANSDFLQEPHRTTIQDTLVDYAELRARFDEFEGSNSKLDEFIVRSEELHEILLDEGTAAVTDDPSPITATYVNSLSELIDIHNLRTDARWNRNPVPVFVTLFLLSLAAMVLVGYRRGLSSTTALPSAILIIFTYTLVFTVVIDLDRHTDGIFSVSQQPVVEVRDKLAPDG